MNFETHLFISYAHVDNKPTADDEGWITRFHKSLESYLSTNLGKDASIWRDDKLQGNDIFGDEIIKQFLKTALLISVLSRRYLESEWCIREVREFCRIVRAKNPGLIVDDKARVFKVMLRPVSTEQRELLPEVMRDMTGYEFYQEEQGDRTIPLDPSFGKKYGEAYKRNIFFLADDMAELITRLEEDVNGEAASEREQAPDKPVIYLAECGYDRREDRARILGDLREHGYTILPDQRLPDLEADYIDEVDRLLAQCTLSVHLIGQGGGGRPDGPGKKSAVVLQNEQAVKQSKAGALQRVIWLPDETRGDDERQQAFIEALHNKAEAQYRADLITGNLEQLKGAIHATLKKLEKPEEPEAQPVAGAGPRMAYLICDEQERMAPDIIKLFKFLKGKGLDVKLPVFTGDTTAVREANETLMKSCDIVLLYYGKGPETWKLSMESELEKMNAYRGDNPLQAAFTYLAEPATDHKQFMILTEEPNLINGLEGFSEAEMDAFVQALTPRTL